MKLKSFDASGDEVRIEIVPLMDVIFCILTFFILGAVGLTRQQAIEQSLPQASTGEQQMREMFRVSIDPIGRIYIDRDPVEFEELPERLQAYQAENPEGLVVVFGHPMAQYDDVLQVLDLLRSIGGDRVSLGVNPSDDSALERYQRQNPLNRIPTTPQTPFSPATPTSPNPNSGFPRFESPTGDSPNFNNPATDFSPPGTETPDATNNGESQSPTGDSPSFNNPATDFFQPGTETDAPSNSESEVEEPAVTGDE
jgi:biopolymer transport protein ExbD